MFTDLDEFNLGEGAFGWGKDEDTLPVGRVRVARLRLVLQHDVHMGPGTDEFDQTLVRCDLKGV